MSNYPHHKVGCDAHKHYSLFSVLDDRGISSSARA